MSGQLNYNRLKGEQTTVQLVDDEGNIETWTDVLSFNWNTKQTILESEYLGQTTTAHSQTFHGTAGDISVHISSGTAQDFILKLAQRARREIPYFAVRLQTVITTTNMVDEAPYMLQFSDVQIADPKWSAGKRDDFVVLSFNWATDDQPKKLA